VQAVLERVERGECRMGPERERTRLVTGIVVPFISDVFGIQQQTLFRAGENAVVETRCVARQQRDIKYPNMIADNTSRVVQRWRRNENGDRFDSCTELKDLTDLEFFLKEPIKGSHVSRQI